MNKYIVTLLEMRDKAHLIHWNTQSYSEHVSMGTFYDELLELIDKYVETYQGKYGRLQMSGLAEIKVVVDAITVVNDVYITAGEMELELDASCSDLKNILADIKGLCNQTKFMLTLNK